MRVAELEQKIADRFRELFHCSWAGAVNSLVTMLISIWIYASIWENRHSLNNIPPYLHHISRPLTWWQVQLAQVGIHYPHWLANVTDWHAPHDGSVVLFALVVGAIGATTGMRRSGAPGFSIVALLALVLSAQWFGLGRTMTVYAELIATLVAVALGMSLRRWLNDRRRIISKRGGVRFSISTVIYGLMGGPVGVLLIPLIYPIILLWKAIRTLGYDPDQQGDPPAIELLRKELWDLEDSVTPLNDLPAAEAARLLATIQVIAASPELHRRALDVLSYRPPMGARPIQRESLVA